MTQHRSSPGKADTACSCCKVESVVSIDARGQMVLPKEVREKAGFHAGDKLALLSWESEGKVCCISLVKADSLSGAARDLLEPVMKDMNLG